MNQTYHVQVSMNQLAEVKTGFTFKQGDFGFNIAIEVMDFDATGTTPQIVFRKANGAVESTDVTVAGNIYTYTVKGNELDTPGIGVCDIKLKNSTTQRISTASFQYEVIADTLGGLNERTNSYSDTIGQIWETLQDYSEVSEAWAVGSRGGVPVDSSQPQFANNAKWYGEHAITSAQQCDDIYVNLLHSMGLGTFSYSNGKLYYNAGVGNQYSFTLQNGNLMVTRL